MTLIYPIGIPLIFLILLLRNVRSPKLETEISLAFLYEAYQRESWFFELLDIAHKLFLSSLLVFFPKDFQIPVGLVVAVGYCVTILLLKPYVRVIDDRLHLLAQCELLVIFTSGWVLYTETDGAQITSFTDIALSSLLIAVTLGLFALFCYHVFIFLRTRYYALKRKATKLRLMSQNESPLLGQSRLSDRSPNSPTSSSSSFEQGFQSLGSITKIELSSPPPCETVPNAASTTAAIANEATTAAAPS
jgi:hypothetical protein